jgi:hypothetical protein
MNSDAINAGNTTNAKRPAIVSTVSILFLAVCMPAFLLSPFCRLHPGLVLVLMGVVGEVIELIADIIWEEQSRKLRLALKTWGLIFWAIVVFGLLWEFREASKSDIEVKQLQSDIETGRSNNLVLQANVLTLQLKLQPRRIMPDQRTNFVFLSHFIPKLPIRILITQEGRDTEDFGVDLRETLTMAGFPMPANGRPFGIERSSALHFYRHISALVKPDPDLIFLNYYTGEGPHFVSNRVSMLQNGMAMPTDVETNYQSVFVALKECFEEIGFIVEFQSDTNLVKEGESMILIPVK